MNKNRFQDREEFLRNCNEINMNLRTKVFCYADIIVTAEGESPVNLTQEKILKNLNLITVLAIKNVLTYKLDTVINSIQRSGVKGTLITGDNLATATHLAKEMGLIDIATNDTEERQLCKEGSQIQEIIQKQKLEKQQNNKKENKIIEKKRIRQ